MAEDIAQLLDELGLDQYVQAFAENGIDLDILPSLSDDDLNELGLNLGDRRRLQRALQSPSSDEKELAASALTKEQTAARSIGPCRGLPCQLCQGSGSLNGPELPSIIMPMITDLDIYRSANILVRHHGQDAPIYAAMRADAMLDKGDLDGYAV